MPRPARTPRTRPGRSRARRGATAATASGRSAAARTPLTRERIVAAALELVDRDGLAAFSLRALGAALGCEPMSVYHHFRSKRHLEDAMVDHALAGLATKPPEADPFDRLRAMARSYRELAHRHPKLFPLVAVHRLNTPAGVRLLDEILDVVRAAAPDDRQAAQWFRAIGYYVTGAALDETSGYAGGPSAAEPVGDAHVAAHCPRLAAAAPYFGREWWDGTFELGLDALLAAMRAAADPRPVSVAPKPVVHPKR